MKTRHVAALALVGRSMLNPRNLASLIGAALIIFGSILMTYQTTYLGFIMIAIGAILIRVGKKGQSGVTQY
jgi:hypothetical protein